MGYFADCSNTSILNSDSCLVCFQVLDYDLQRQLVKHMQSLTPLPSIYDKSFIAANQADRADNLIAGESG